MRNGFKGYHIDTRGYKWLWINNKYILEHRHVMQEHLNRNLETKEHIHHKDGDPLNNSLDNLEMLTASEHAKTHGWFKERKHKINDSGTHLWCPGCKKELSVDNFWKDNCSSTGYQGLCKICKNANRRAYRHRKGISKTHITKYKTKPV